MKKRILVLGDIHGNLTHLIKALDLAGFEPGDTLIFLGDYINRGNESREVLNWLLEIKKTGEHVFLRGNHEDMILKLLAGEAQHWYNWLEYGQGRNCMKSYGYDPGRIFYREEGYYLKKNEEDIALNGRETQIFIRQLFPEDHLAFFQETMITYETDDYFFCHAGLESGLNLSEQGVYSDALILWGDEDFLRDRNDYGKTIVYGHYHQKEPVIQRNRICLALEDAVAVLSIPEGIIYDSLGRTFNVIKAL